MTIRIGNAPCSWGVEFASDPRNPGWRDVLRDCAAAGYGGIELGPVGYMPEDPCALRDGLDEFGLELIGGVVYRPFSEPGRCDDVWDGVERTCRALAALGAQHLVLIDAISPRRAHTMGRVHEAEEMTAGEWRDFVDRLRRIARTGTEEFGLTASIHAHAAGFMDFEPELERLMGEIDDTLLKICLDTGHHALSGSDPVSFMARYMDRIAYVHFKDTDPDVKARVVSNRTAFNEACAEGVFCTLGQGEVNFDAVRQLLLDAGYDGWCTVEQDCDPIGPTSPVEDARANRAYLASIGF